MKNLSNTGWVSTSYLGESRNVDYFTKLTQHLGEMPTLYRKVGNRRIIDIGLADLIIDAVAKGVSITDFVRKYANARGIVTNKPNKVSDVRTFEDYRLEEWVDTTFFGDPTETLAATARYFMKHRPEFLGVLYMKATGNPKAPWLINPWAANRMRDHWKGKNGGNLSNLIEEFRDVVGEYLSKTDYNRLTRMITKSQGGNALKAKARRAAYEPAMVHTPIGEAFVIGAHELNKIGEGSEIKGDQGSGVSIGKRVINLEIALGIILVAVVTLTIIILLK
jgi:hypothetical protein